MVPKIVLKIYVQELHISMVGPPEEVGLKEAKYANNNITISDSMLRKILSPQLNKISAWYKVICGCWCCISSKIIHQS